MYVLHHEEIRIASSYDSLSRMLQNSNSAFFDVPENRAASRTTAQEAASDDDWWAMSRLSMLQSLHLLRFTFFFFLLFFCATVTA